MNITVFADAVERLKSYHETVDTLTELEKLASSADAASAAPTQQQEYVNERKRIISDFIEFADTYLFDYQVTLINDAGLTILLPNEMVRKIKLIIRENENTLAVLATQLRELQTDIESKIGAIKSIIQSLEALSIDTDFLNEGDSAIIVQIPANVFDAHPAKLGTSLKDIATNIEKIVSDIVGNPQEVKLLALSNPTPTIILSTTIAGVFAFSKALNNIADACSTFQDVRLKNIEIKNRKKLSAALVKSIESAEKVQRELLEKAFVEQVKIVAKELYSGEENNGELGLEKNLKALISSISDGTQYDVIAIPYDEPDEDDEAEDESSTTISSEDQSMLEAVSETSGISIKLRKLLKDREIVKLLSAPAEADSSDKEGD